jgi:hypothetical protein
METRSSPTRTKVHGWSLNTQATGKEIHVQDLQLLLASFFPALSPLFVESDSICLHLRNNSLCNGEKVSFQKKTPMVSPGTMTNMFPEKRRGYAGGLM